METVEPVDTVPQVCSICHERNSYPLFFLPCLGCKSPEPSAKEKAKSKEAEESKSALVVATPKTYSCDKDVVHRHCYIKKHNLSGVLDMKNRITVVLLLFMFDLHHYYDIHRINNVQMNWLLKGLMFDKCHRCLRKIEVEKSYRGVLKLAPMKRRGSKGKLMYYFLVLISFLVYLHCIYCWYVVYASVEFSVGGKYVTWFIKMVVSLMLTILFQVVGGIFAGNCYNLYMSRLFDPVVNKFAKIGEESLKELNEYHKSAIQLKPKEINGQTFLNFKNPLCEDVIVLILSFLPHHELVHSVCLVNKFHFHIVMFPNIISKDFVDDHYTEYLNYNALWKIFLQRVFVDDLNVVSSEIMRYEKMINQKICIVSFKNLFVSHLSSKFTCFLCKMPINYKEKLRKECLYRPCLCEFEGACHRVCHDVSMREKIKGIFPVNVFTLMYTFLRTGCKIDINDTFHKQNSLFFRKCEKCGFFYHLKQKEGVSLLYPYLIFSAILFVSVAVNVFLLFVLFYYFWSWILIILGIGIVILTLLRVIFGLNYFFQFLVFLMFFWMILILGIDQSTKSYNARLVRIFRVVDLSKREREDEFTLASVANAVGMGA